MIKKLIITFFIFYSTGARAFQTEKSLFQNEKDLVSFFCLSYN